jgi:hypothetical protein
MSPLTRHLWLPAFLLLLGCTTAEPDQQAIRDLLAERQQALNARNLERYVAILSPGYRDKGLDYAGKRTELAQTLASWDEINFTADPYRITIQGSSARAKGTYRLRVARSGKKLELGGEEELRLAREAGTWKITGGL